MPTKIEWANETWNPVTGCAKVSPGCVNCYAERMAKRLGGRFGYPADDPFRVTTHLDRVFEPMERKKSCVIFVCSMGDMFHPDVPSVFIRTIYSTMTLARQHTFIVCTKRPERLIPVLYEEGLGHFGGGDFLPTVWHLTSTENQREADRRIPELLKLRNASSGWPVLGVSVEPMLGPVTLISYLFGSCRNGIEGRDKLDWVVCGAETGPGARAMDIDWGLSLHAQCKSAGVPFFFKKGSRGQVVPDDLILREFPSSTNFS